MRKKAQTQTADLNALRVVSVARLADLLGVHRATLHRWSRSGVLPAPRQFGPGRIGWLASEVEKWIASRPAVAGAPTLSEAA